MNAYEVYELLAAAFAARKLTRHRSRFKKDLEAFLAETGGYFRLQAMLSRLSEHAMNYAHAELQEAEGKPG